MNDPHKRRNAVLFTAFGETKTLAEWCRDERCKVCAYSLRQRMERVNAGTMTAEDAITKQPRFDRHKPIKNGSRVNHTMAKALDLVNLVKDMVPA